MTQPRKGDIIEADVKIGTTLTRKRAMVTIETPRPDGGLTISGPFETAHGTWSEHPRQLRPPYTMLERAER